MLRHLVDSFSFIPCRSFTDEILTMESTDISRVSLSIGHLAVSDNSAMYAVDRLTWTLNSRNQVLCIHAAMYIP